MNISMLLSNLGSLFLGVTLSFAILFSIGGRHTELDGAEGCLGVLICVCGGSVALVFYIAAINTPA
jgi:hypothetical protein